MGDAHRGIGGVHMLPPGPAGSHGINANIVWINVNIHILRFRQYRHCGR